MSKKAHRPAGPQLSQTGAQRSGSGLERRSKGAGGRRLFCRRHKKTSEQSELCSDVEPESLMEKYLFAADELTGLIGAAALMRPTGFEGMETKSVMKKFKDKKFAAGCSRDVISQGAQMLGLTVQELVGEVLPAMQSMPEQWP